VAAIGIFDGVHRGHQKILRRAAVRAQAISGTPVAITFYPHPLAVLAPAIVPPQILSLDQRLRVFAALGIRAALVIPFTRRFSLWSAEEFVQRLLVGCLRVREVVVGHDFGFGHNRSGTTQTLKTFGRRFGFRVHVVPPVREGGKRISSRRIRETIQQGRLSEVERCVGSPVAVVGKVVRGSKRGTGLGFPTANLKVETGVLPPVGVYAVRAKLNGRPLAGMANIGFRPTFERKKVGSFRNPLLEVHLFGIRRSLYGRELEVAFIQRLRPERRFGSAQALAQQLKLDARQTKKVLRSKKT
jgi:riboflavin kinase/FMN adenylyltransferase